MYGVGIPTERAYVYKLTPAAECYIPFQIDTSAKDKSEDGCLKDGVYTVDGDETVPALSTGYMCAKGWHGKTRFNPSEKLKLMSGNTIKTLHPTFSRARALKAGPM
ncbi:putative transferase [Helianthus anomalus]